MMDALEGLAKYERGIEGSAVNPSATIRTSLTSPLFEEVVYCLSPIWNAQESEDFGPSHSSQELDLRTACCGPQKTALAGR
jgi:hypothetical protein